MNDITERCDVILNELVLFSEDMLYLGPPITDNRLQVLENELGLDLPLDFKYVYKKHNGISLSGTEVFGLDDKLRNSSIDKIYQLEHFEATYQMPLEFLPFSPDGRGNHYCLNLKKLKDGLCPVVFWQWDFDYDNIDEVEECNDSFIDWIKEVMIDWTLEDYNYDGTEK